MTLIGSRHSPELFFNSMSQQKNLLNLDWSWLSSTFVWYGMSDNRTVTQYSGHPIVIHTVSFVKEIIPLPLLVDQWDVTKYLPNERLSDCQEYTLQKLSSNLKDSEFSTDGWNSHMQSECLETQSYRIHIYPNNTDRISLQNSKSIKNKE